MALKFDVGLTELKRKILAVGVLSEHAEATSDHGFPGQEIEDSMRMHRDLVCGNGFARSLIPAGSASLEGMLAEPALEPGSKAVPWVLPTLNLLEGLDKAIVDIIMKFALDDDRQRLSLYMSQRPLGLGIIASVRTTSPV